LVVVHRAGVGRGMYHLRCGHGQVRGADYRHQLRRSTLKAVRHSDEVLKALMTMAGRDSVLVAVSVVDVRRKLVETVGFIDEYMTR
jgi:hypothetical protein